MKRITKYAKDHRHQPTRAEREMKRKLMVWGIRFRSQRMFDYYIVDFLIPDRRLVIEVDGDYHSNRAEYDKRRTRYLEGLGLEVIRVDNKTVLQTSCEEVLQEILSYSEVDISELPHRLSYGRAKY